MTQPMTHPTVEIDDVVHQRARLGILAIVSNGDRVEFGYLKDALDLSPGNLSRHLTTLAEARLITVRKGYQGRRPRTWVSITTAGKDAYDGEVSILRSLLALQDASGDRHPGAAGRGAAGPDDAGPDDAGPDDAGPGHAGPDDAGEPPDHDPREVTP